MFKYLYIHMELQSIKSIFPDFLVNTLLKYLNILYLSFMKNIISIDYAIVNQYGAPLNINHSFFFQKTRRKLEKASAKLVF